MLQQSETTSSTSYIINNQHSSEITLTAIIHDYVYKCVGIYWEMYDDSNDKGNTFNDMTKL